MNRNPIIVVDPRDAWPEEAFELAARTRVTPVRYAMPKPAQAPVRAWGAQ